MNRSEIKRRNRARRRNFIKRVVRKRRATYPVYRRLRFRRRRGRKRTSLRRRVMRTFNRPILVRFFHSREEPIRLLPTVSCGDHIRLLPSVSYGDV